MSSAARGVSGSFMPIAASTVRTTSRPASVRQGKPGAFSG